MSETSHPSRRDVAVAALVDEDKRVLLVRTRRLPEHWQPVGGGVEPVDGGEPRNTAAREIREELGLDLPGEALRLSLTVPYDFGQGTVHFFVAEVPSADSQRPSGSSNISALSWRVARSGVDPAIHG